MLIAALAATLSASAPPNSWSPRGVFAFADLILDFQRGIEKRGPFLAPLKDCSDPEKFCASGSIVRVVLPRSCNISVGQTWSTGGISTHVIARKVEEPSLHSVNEPAYYLSTDTADNVIYEYKPSVGIYAIYHDPLDKIKLTSLARNNKLDELQRDHPNYYLPLNTFDGFGQCGRA